VPVPVPPPCDPHRDRALALEDAKLAHRLTRLHDMGYRLLGELRKLFVAMQRAIDQWLCESYHAEMRAVSTLVAVIGQAIEQGVPLPHPLRLDGTSVLIDETTKDPVLATDEVAAIEMPAPLPEKPGLRDAFARRVRFPGWPFPPRDLPSSFLTQRAHTWAVLFSRSESHLYLTLPRTRTRSRRLDADNFPACAAFRPLRRGRSVGLYERRGLRRCDGTPRDGRHGRTYVLALRKRLKGIEGAWHIDRTEGE